MKIEIEVNAIGNSKITIDGKELIVDYSSGCGASLCGVKAPDTDDTVGGAVAVAIYDKIYDIHQALAAVQDLYGEGYETWKTMSSDAAEAFTETLPL